MNGLFFALRSGQEHRNLQFNNCQIQVVERVNEVPYLEYREDISKNNPGGLKGRKHVGKVVQHHANTENPSRCFVRLFKLYKSLCPPEPKRNAFYLKPLKKTSRDRWFSADPVGHNVLSKTVSRLCIEAGITGFKTNHSLRVSAATRLFETGLDEQLIMERTGHKSTDGVRTYKRTSEIQRQEVSDILNKSKRACTNPSRIIEPMIVQPLQSQELSNTTPVLTATQLSHENSFQHSTSLTNMPGAFNIHSCYYQH